MSNSAYHPFAADAEDYASREKHPHSSDYWTGIKPVTLEIDESFCREFNGMVSGWPREEGSLRGTAADALLYILGRLRIHRYTDRNTGAARWILGAMEDPSLWGMTLFIIDERRRNCT